MSKTADSGIDEQQRQANEGIYDLVKGANGNSYWTKPPDSGVKESLTKLVNMPKRVTEQSTTTETHNG